MITKTQKKFYITGKISFKWIFFLNWQEPYLGPNYISLWWNFHSWNPPPPPPPFTGGEDFPKIESLGGMPKILLEKGDNPERGVDVEMGGCHFFITLQFNCIYYVFRGKFPFITFCFFSLLS